MKNFQKGFTLIELLVVIAIIGILSSIVLASLSSARSKGEDAAIQTTLSNMRGQAELLYSNISSYGIDVTAGDCSTATANNIFGTSTVGSLKNLTTDLISKAGGAANTRCIASSTGWGAAAKLKSDPNKIFCADSNGTSKISAQTTLGAALTGAGCI